MLFTTLGLDDESERRLIAMSIPLVAICGGLLVCVISIIANGISRAVQTRHREESRREIAAYVAEGTLSPDDAFRLLEAGKNKKNSACG
jgi:hypothetical protein